MGAVQPARGYPDDQGRPSTPGGRDPDGSRNQMSLGIPIPTKHHWHCCSRGARFPAASLVVIQRTSNADIPAHTGDHPPDLVMVLGLAAMAASFVIGYQRLGQISYPLFGVCILLLILLVLDRKMPIPFVEPRRTQGVGLAQEASDPAVELVEDRLHVWGWAGPSGTRAASGALSGLVCSLSP